MDNKLLEKTRNKLKHELSSEEQEALRRCSATVNTHSRIGAVLGGSLSVYGMYRRKLWPLSKFWGRGLFFGIGGIVVGMQLGLVSASIRCVQIVKALPDPQHVMKALREVQVELQDARRRPLQGEREWKQRSGDSETEMVDSSGGFSMENSDSRSWDQPSTDFSAKQSSTPNSKKPYNGPGPDPSLAEMKDGRTTQNIWQQIRGENASRPETAWDRLRKTGTTTAAAATSQSAQDDSPFSMGSPDVEANLTQKQPETSISAEQAAFDSLLERERSGASAAAIDRPRPSA